MKNGFTLVELSIVLVIIGLLIGGILVGQSMIESAKINSVVRQVQQLNILVGQFKSTYRYYPGDLPDAYSYFGANCGPNSVKGGISFQVPGCNGDGDGIVKSSHPNESDNFWWHMSLSGIGDFNYTSPFLDQEFIADQNIPSSEFDTILRANNGASDGFVLGMHKLLTSTTITDTSTIPPAIAYSIDNKLDDGNSITGKVKERRSFYTSGGNGPCSEHRTTGLYDLNVTTDACTLYFFAFDEYK